ncbi:unnamed protein product [Chrysoparadoxa australica]
MEVCFEFTDPNESFFHSLRALVDHFLPPSALEVAIGGVNLSELVDLILNQGAVGTLVIQEGGDDVFAFITALPLQFHRSVPAVASLCNFLLKSAGDQCRPALEKLLGKGEKQEGADDGEARPKVGLLLREQMVNLPLQIMPKLHEALQEDIAWALENEITEEHKEKFRYDYYLLVAPCDGAADSSEGAKGSSSSAAGVRLQDLYFHRFDDEVFFEAAELFFAIPMPSAAPGATAHTGSNEGEGGAKGKGKAKEDLVRRYRAVAVLKSDAYAECVEKVKMMVGEA